MPFTFQPSGRGQLGLLYPPDPPEPRDPRCVCGRRWSEHRTSTACPNPECWDGGVGYEDDPDNPLRDCWVCHGLARVPLASGGGYEDCWKFSEAEDE